MNSVSLYFFLGAVALAVVLALSALILAFKNALRGGRDYLDPVPFGWRMFWPTIETLGFWIKPWVDSKAYQRVSQAIQAMGWHFWINPYQFIALRLVSSGLGFCAGSTFALALDSGALLGAGGGAALGWWLPATYAKERAEKRRVLTLRQLPFFIDLLILGVESGQPLSLAMSMAINHGSPGPLRDELQRMQRDVRAGRGRHQALDELGTRMAHAEVSTLISTLNLAEQQGMQLGPLLRAQAETRRNERFLRAEKLAMQAPVKMLFPLIFCIFPGTFAIILFPIALQMMSGGSLF
jgi:tight adherence protein C